MAGFGRSNSLSINTSGGGLFGNNAGQAQSGAGLFGSSTTTTTSQQPQVTLGATSQPQSGGLFSSVPQQGATSSLLGGQVNAGASQPTSLFGSSNTLSASAAPTGMFNAATAQPQLQPAGGLFGTSLASTVQNTTSGGLFGQTQAQKPSLFGAATTQQSNAVPRFGATQQSQPLQSNSMFGGLLSQNTSLGQGSSGLMASTGQAVQMSGLESVKGTTRFSDLHPSIQSDILRLDEEIQKKIGKANVMRESLPKHVEDVASVAPDVAFIAEALAITEMGLDNDSANIAQVRTLVKKDAEDAALSFRAIENQKLPAQFHYGNASNLTTITSKQPNTSGLGEEDAAKPVDLVGYFKSRASNLSNTLDMYQRQISEIEAHLRTLEVGTVEKAHQLHGGRHSVHDQRRQLVEALKAIEGAILESAKTVGKVRDEVAQRSLGQIGVS